MANHGEKLPRATLQQKITVLDYIKGPPQSNQHEVYLKVAKENKFAFSQATLSNWIINEPQLRLEYLQGGNVFHYKRKPVLKNPELTNAVEADIRSNFQIGQSLSDKTLRDLFIKYNESLGTMINDLKLSAGMLHSFKRRNGIRRGKYFGTTNNDRLTKFAAQNPGNQIISQIESNTNAPVTANPTIHTTTSNQVFDFDFNEILNNTDIGFNTRLIHSDDNLSPFLNMFNNDPNMLLDNQNNTPIVPNTPSTNLDLADSNHQQHAASHPLLQQAENQESYPSYPNPFHSTAHYKRRKESSKKIGNPNSEKIEKILETITEGKVTLYNSGTSAIMGVLSYINPKNVFIDNNGYRGTHKVIDLLSKLTGLKKYNLNDLNSLKDGMLDDSVIILESPQNPLGYVHDLSYYSRISSSSTKCKLLVDSTLAPPPLQFPFKFGADFIVYSAVKYLAGVSDLSAGFVVSLDNVCKLELHDERLALGTSIAIFDSFLLLRSLRTYRMRITTQCLNTERLVTYLSKNFSKYELVLAKIYHSSLQPNSEIVRKQLNGYYNPVFAIEMKMDWMVKEVLNGFQFLSNNPNLEGGETLVETVKGNPNFISSNLNGTLMRFSVGCEDFQDIIRDVDQALLNVVKKCSLVA